jgi:hypothetical protein
MWAFLGFCLRLIGPGLLWFLKISIRPIASFMFMVSLLSISFGSLVKSPPLLAFCFVVKPIFLVIECTFKK